MPALPMAMGAGEDGLARSSSACTPASPPKLFQVAVASAQSTVDSLIVPAGATVEFVTSSVRVAEVMVDPAGICPGLDPKMASKRINPNSALGAGFSVSHLQLSSAPSTVPGAAWLR